jgi:hypothetical protein
MMNKYAISNTLPSLSNRKKSRRLYFSGFAVKEKHLKTDISQSARKGSSIRPRLEDREPCSLEDGGKDDFNKGRR